MAFLTATLMGAAAFGAVTDLPTTVVKGVKCYYYDVQQRESVYQVINKLGVTRQQIAEFNPSAADGLKPRMRLYFPVSAFGGNDAAGNGKAVYAAAAGVTTHRVKKGETIYGIARKYGMTPDELSNLNPALSNGLREGDLLRITQTEEVASAGNEMAAQGGAGAPSAGGNPYSYKVYEIKKGETLFSIANSNGIGLEELIAANPGIDPMRYKSGDRIRIPVVGSDAVETTGGGGYAATTAPVIAATEADEEEMEDDAPVGVTSYDAPVAPYGAGTAGEDVAETDDVFVEAEAVEPMNVAVMLPFMLSEESQSRTTQLYTEFFKGMLMAADTLRQGGGAPVKFTFYDTASSMDTVQALLQRPEIAEMDMVVAPDNAAHLAAIVDGVDDETLVLNIFAVKDEAYKTHRNMIQTNIPHDAMYERAIDGFMRKYAGRLPVFINRNGGQADKETFVSALKERLDAEGWDYRTVTFNSSLGDEDLAGIDASVTPVVFVPNSGSKNEFAKFVRALTNMRANCADGSNVTIFGYPEWVTFRDESLEEICNLDATIYSRFLVDENDFNARNLKERYKELYGVEMFEAVPTQGILGYDIGVFIIEGLRRMADTGAFPENFRGVQNTLRLEWSGGRGEASDDYGVALPVRGGLVNNALFFISYAPGGRVESECL